MKTFFRFLLYTLVFVLPIVGLGGIGAFLSMRNMTSRAPDAVRSAVVPAPAPVYDPHKPTVAIVLGGVTEITDALGPYALFAESGLYNVYTVAATRDLQTLTGGLDVMPHYAFAELDKLLGHSPEIVVLPNIPTIDAPQERPVLDWVKRQNNGRTILFSWCAGAHVLAAAGVLDGKAATTHWVDIYSLERAYPAVHWQRGVRYVDQGNILTSAGVTSGIDATLYLLQRLHGSAVMERVAQAIHYPSLQFVDKPEMQQYELGLANSIPVLNMAFTWPKQQTGVWLYDGVGEMELAAVFDVYGAAGTDQMYSAAAKRSIRSLHGLQVIARRQTADLPKLDRLIVPGGVNVAEVAATLAADSQVHAPLLTLANPSTPTFAVEAALEEFARSHNVPTARFAAKRLEYRAASLQLTGKPWLLQVFVLPLLIGGLGLGITRWLSKRWWKRRRPDQVTSAASPRWPSQLKEVETH